MTKKEWRQLKAAHGDLQRVMATVSDALQEAMAAALLKRNHPRGKEYQEDMEVLGAVLYRLDQGQKLLSDIAERRLAAKLRRK